MRRGLWRVWIVLAAGCGSTDHAEPRAAMELVAVPSVVRASVPSATSTAGEVPTRRAETREPEEEPIVWTMLEILPGATVEMPDQPQRDVDYSLWVMPKELKGTMTAYCEKTDDPIQRMREMRDDYRHEMKLGPITIVLEEAFERDGHPGLRFYLDQGEPPDQTRHLLLAGHGLVCHLMSFATSGKAERAATDRFFDSLRMR